MICLIESLNKPFQNVFSLADNGTPEIFKIPWRSEWEISQKKEAVWVEKSPKFVSVI